MKIVLRLWRDERGSQEAFAWLLIAVVIALGGIAGLTPVRDQIVQELGDLSVALESLNQSYSAAIITPSATIVSQYTDPPTTLTDPPGAAPAGIEFVGGASESP
jgi:Flp pilus assembly pilin Flp